MQVISTISVVCLLYVLTLEKLKFEVHKKKAHSYMALFSSYHCILNCLSSHHNIWLYLVGFFGVFFRGVGRATACALQQRVASSLVMSFDSRSKRHHTALPIFCLSSHSTLTKWGLKTNKNYGTISALERPSCESTAVLNFRFENILALKNGAKLSI